MKMMKWVSAIIVAILLLTPLSIVSYADEARTIADESIYDVLVDRYFNKTAQNDINVDRQDATQFAGGDFAGLVEKLPTIKKMGFTITSIGTVFTTETYEGWTPTSYENLEPHFGTEQELADLILAYNKEGIQIMVDFPLSNVSVNHEWAQDPAKQGWIKSQHEELVQWDLTNLEVQAALQEALMQFVESYNFGGIRLTNIGDADTAFLNSLIEAVKTRNNAMYVITNEDSDANFDAKFAEDAAEIYRDIFKNVDLPTNDLLKHIEPYLAGEQVAPLLMIDSLQTNRFVLDATEQKMFPPTRLKTALLPIMFLPGVPVVQYGTEIAMNGVAGEQAHQIYNFKTEEELVDYIGNLQSIRSKSAAMRQGDFSLVENDNGLIAFTRKSDEEQWLVIANNTSKTKQVVLTAADIGEDKELRGVLSNEIVKQNKNSEYIVVLDREVSEIYQIIDERGWNIPYLVALGIVYVLFVIFVIAIIKRGRKKRNLEENTEI
ncbi:alpha-amylase family glycosyl hydrolase [Metasolibacillus meyeri]|uniref:Alpha-amylase family glycosyl hydrolase n=1 Tax=Metasolibacillus meyeri TaxID=1071052 RepID=A0AAW9NV99_9BACL|nr:alpha-amylase family glycosyl hydrolase [Metasolibacillus meyeri]MEC1178833.1 alpha-amylase family glycosyl hydrolase [Metasolibacillus meyeri]